ncbi:ABC transporter permease [Sorangium sp. So ce590]|uniref:ABC transporter permease n=1 Tax=unclassified Sorangium TaxID=2621164 RepID=UPI003F6119EA
MSGDRRSPPPSRRRPLLTLLALDARVVLRHRFVHIVVAMAVLFGGLVGFALPERVGGEKQAFVLSRAPVAGGAPSGIQRVDDEGALREALARDREALGVVIDRSGDVQALVRGYESARVQSLEVAAARVAASRVRGDEVERTYTVSTLRAPSPTPPFNGTMLPIFYAVDIAIIGFLFGAVMVLQEKTFGTVRFYRIAPGGPLVYIASKLLVNAGLAALGTLVLTGFGLPSALLNLPALALVIGAAAGLTLFGVGLSVFFANLSAFFYPLVLVGIGLSVPMAAYELPSLDMPLLRLLPTYHVMFGTRELLFPSGKEAVVLDAALGIGGFFVVAALFAYVAVSRRLMREVR